MALGDRSNRSSTAGGREPPTPEESFEDVGLGDDGSSSNKHGQPQHRKGFFSKFGGQQQGQEPGATQSAQPTVTTTTGGVSRFLIPGRKRGQSGQGSELGQMERPRTATSLDSKETREAS